METFAHGASGGPWYVRRARQRPYVPDPRYTGGGVAPSVMFEMFERNVRISRGYNRRFATVLSGSHSMPTWSPSGTEEAIRVILGAVAEKTNST